MRVLMLLAFVCLSAPFVLLALVAVSALFFDGKPLW